MKGSVMIESPVECACGHIYDGAGWEACPHCTCRSLQDRCLEFEIAIDEAILFLAEQAPMHAADTLKRARRTSEETGK